MAAAVAISPPPRSGNNNYLTQQQQQQQQQQQPPWKSHSVSRSNEFLSAARTALKIAQQQHYNRQQQIQNGTYISGSGKENELPEWMINITPATELNLFQPQPSYSTQSNEEDDTISLIQDSQTLLKLLDEHLLELHTLVRRRGHTNDPTLEISTTIDKFQEGAQEIKVVCDTLRLAGTKPLNEQSNLNVLYGGGTKRSSAQRRKHYELLSSQLESKAKERTDQLKKELETRSKVLRDQTTRRKMLASGGGVSSSNGSAAPAASGVRQPIAARLPTQKRGVNTSSQFQSPLFTSTQTGISSSGGGITNRKNATKSTKTSKPGGYSGYAGYGGSSAAAAPSSGTGYGGTSYGSAGYGGTTTSAPTSFATGMRQRKHQGGPSYTQQQQQQQPKSSIQIDSGQDDDYEDKYTKNNGESSVQAQILQRRNNRATKNRAAQARLAEKSIAELGVMFTKMSSLISQQGEVLERIEDDVEAAGLDIDAGHDELVKVYGMTKGNRGLILKVFGILIFLIIFMKLY